MTHASPVKHAALADEAAALLRRMGANTGPAGDLIVRSPIDGSTLASLAPQGAEAVAAAIGRAEAAFPVWRDVPAPKRGELVRLFGEELRAHKADLGRLVTTENGKILQEGLGEVQEMIDIFNTRGFPGV